MAHAIRMDSMEPLLECCLSVRHRIYRESIQCNVDLCVLHLITLYLLSDRMVFTRAFESRRIYTWDILRVRDVLLCSDCLDQISQIKN